MDRVAERKPGTNTSKYVKQGGYAAMLVLSRKIGERVAIGDDTVLIVRSISGGAVRIAIQAPRAMTILRGELSVSKQDGPAIVAAKSARRLA
jgi:carbon storage regulator